MATAPLVQDLFALTAHGVASTAPYEKGTPLELLGSTSAASSSDAVVLTVQASGLSIYNAATAHCTHSFSVPAAVTFACAAVLLPLKEEGDNDAVEDSEESNTNNTDSNNGFVCAIVRHSQEKKMDGRRLWLWAVGEAAAAAKVGGKLASGGPGKPDWVKTFDIPVHHIAVHASKVLIVIHTSGVVSFYNHDLVRPVLSIKSKIHASVVWSQCVPISESTHASVSEIVNVVKLEDGKLVARTARVETKFGGEGVEDVHNILSQGEFPLDFAAENASVVSYCFAAEQKKLFVALSTGEVRGVALKPSGAVSTINLAPLGMSCFNGKASALAGIVPPAFAMQVVGKSYLAIVGVLEKKGSEQDILSIWDTRFGTLQFRRVLNGDNEAVTQSSDPLNLIGKESFFGRCFNIEAAVSSLSGPVLSITTSTIRSKPAKNMVSFTSSVALAPFYCPPVSLLTAFGKLSNTMKFSLSPSQEGILPGLATVAQRPPIRNNESVTWYTGLSHLEDLDRTYLTRITASNHNADHMALELARWVYEKSLLVAPKSGMPKPGDTLATVDFEKLPVIEISQPGMIKLLTRALASNVKDFYPVKVLQYLVRTGRVPASFTVQDDSATASIEQTRTVSIVECVLLQNDFQTLCMMLNNDACLGMNEFDVLQIAQYICCCATSSGSTSETETSQGVMDRRRSTIDAYVKTQVGSNKNGAYKKCLVRNDKGLKVFDGRRWFFEKVFAIPQQNDFVFAKALKALSVDQVEVVMSWVVGLLEMDVRKKTEVTRKRAAIQKRKETVAAAAARKKGKSGIEVVDKFAFIDDMLEKDLDGCLAESEIRRQLWWLWDTPGKANEYSGAVMQAIDVINLIIDVHLTTILLTPSLHDLVVRLQVCVSSDLTMFNMMQRRLNGCLSVFELSEAAKTKAATSMAGLSGDQKSAKKQEVVGTELRRRWKRMVAQVNDGVGSYAVELGGF
ncbi:hypothetical protein HDU98_006248 [Podochytrium sp. JEL0797]|nr:hypothetical protein HDU98_006248 [Podochytrium sp. JEL0797]